MDVAQGAGNDQLGHLVVDRLLPRVTEDLFSGGIPVANAAVGPHHDHGVERGPEDASHREAVAAQAPLATHVNPPGRPGGTGLAPGSRG